MKLRKKETTLCILSGLLISIIVFFITYQLNPTLLTNEGFMIAVGLAPTVIIVGVRLNINEKKENEQN